MPDHKMITIGGVRVRAGDEARYRARHTTTGPLGMRHADPPPPPPPGDDGEGQDPAGPRPDGTTGPGDAPGDAEVFDPGAHTVPDVLAYLAAADEAEIRRVLDAEAVGQARTTILRKDSTS
ncbi:hypothetical protein [Streptomyces uncialis]|uniref:hypothetical protein n=1 Tax=Streptomyces uncialis TaxID=1048205 RepID=UPI002257BFDC|nr:hypothetical protein [Streptomyces uncialis]MCX4661495.1 hypothetical protein [Streptomyces uncialis]